MSGVELVTRGYITSDVAHNQLASCDEPEVVASQEVKPKITRTEEVVEDLRPKILKAEEE